MIISTTPLDNICGMHTYSTDQTKRIDGIWRSIEDFLVEEAISRDYILDIENPRLHFSGYAGLFTCFVLVKRNIDTFTATRILSRIWRVPQHYIFFSGLKDKEAITAQRGCVFGVSPSTIKSCTYPRSIKIYSPIRELRRIKIGSHWGNRFTIKLHDVEGDFDFISGLDKAIFLNYFGYQRFGIWKPISHIAGKMILQNRYREALLLFLVEVNPTFENRDDFIFYVDNLEYKKALRLLPPHKFEFEQKILRMLIRGLSDRDMIKAISRSLLRIFIEAYQAFLFNITLDEIAKNFDRLPKKVPIVGYNYADSINGTTIDPSISEIIASILEREGITPKLFGKFHRVQIARGGFRGVTFRIEKFSAKKTNGDLTIKFLLRRGSFATVVLREILKDNISKLLLSRKKRGSTDILKKMREYYGGILKKYFQKIDNRFLMDFSSA